MCVCECVCVRLFACVRARVYFMYLFSRARIDDIRDNDYFDDDDDDDDDDDVGKCNIIFVVG